jgi:hypothetical protein
MTTVALLAMVATTAHAQEKVEAKPEDKPKTLLEEIVLFGYVENSYVWNLGRPSQTSQPGQPGLTTTNKVNSLRLYDIDEGYTFNMAELSAKKDPSDKYPFGFGLVITGGEDAQKNHGVGIFRDLTDAPRQTAKVDLQEAYLSYRVPLGSGLTVKAGKFVTLLGYEVIESPNNLNFSRSYLFTFAIPLTHVGGLLSYSLTDWFSVTAGVVEGWDVADDNNRSASFTGQLALTPLKDLSTNLNWIVGPEQSGNSRGNHPNSNNRWVTDLVATYTGIKNVTLGLNVDVGDEQDEPNLAVTRRDADASWWGAAAYAAYDWTEKLRTALRVEYFQDTDGIRTFASVDGAGDKVGLWEVTATAQYKIWKGLVGRVEYRHDDASRDAFGVRRIGGVATPTRNDQDTIGIDLYYLFF